MAQNRYTIQEVAKLHNISKKALLYYEKKGIFMPDFIDPISSYRYYSHSQFSRLKTIVMLKEYGQYYCASYTLSARK